jgi:hypothetical protein
MKWNKHLLVAGVMAAMFATQGSSCPQPNPSKPEDPYRVARTTITVMRATLTGGKVAFDGVVQAVQTECTISLCQQLHPDKTSQKYKDCLAEDHSQEPEYKKCDKVSAAVPWVEKGYAIGIKTCDASMEAIELAAQLAVVRNDKALKKKCADGDQEACAKYKKRVDEICAQVDPSKGQDYQDCVEGKPVAKADWSGISKRGACLVDSSLTMVPSNPKYNSYIAAVRTWLRSYGNCK